MIIAEGLGDYLQRHSEIESGLLKNKQVNFYTTDDVSDFNEKAKLFYGECVNCGHVNME